MAAQQTACVPLLLHRNYQAATNECSFDSEPNKIPRSRGGQLKLTF